MLLGEFWDKFTDAPDRLVYFISDENIEDSTTLVEEMDGFMIEYGTYKVKNFEISKSSDGFNLYVEI